MTNELLNEIYVVETPQCSWCGNGGVVEVPAPGLEGIGVGDTVVDKGSRIARAGQQVKEIGGRYLADSHRLNDGIRATEVGRHF